MKIERVLNNNAAIVLDERRAQSIVLGKGIAHGKRRGDGVEAGLIDQVFVPDGSHSLSKLTAYLTDIPFDVIRVARFVAELARDRLGLQVTQSLILPIADHLHFATVRVTDGIQIDYPLRWEVNQLYPAEVAVGRDAVMLVNQRLRVRLPADEALPLALHFVNAQFAVQGLARTVKMTEKITQILQVVSSATGLRVDSDSMTVSRFVTHLRYLFVRIDSERQIAGSPTPLMTAIRDAYPQASMCAQRIRYLLEIGGAKVTDDEVQYLTLHVARLIADLPLGSR